MDSKSTKIGKLYGNPSFATGPKAGAGTSATADGNASKGSFATGPNAVAGAIGHKAKGTSVSGTKGDEKGETSAGMASGKRGNAKA